MVMDTWDSQYSRVTRQSSAVEYACYDPLGQGLLMAALAGVGSYGIVFHTKIARSSRRPCSFKNSKGECAPAVFFDSHRPLHYSSCSSRWSRRDSAMLRISLASDSVLWTKARTLGIFVAT